MHASAKQPRHHAEDILRELNGVLRERLRQVPPEQRGIVLDHVQDHIARRHFRRLERQRSTP